MRFLGLFCFLALSCCSEPSLAQIPAFSGAQGPGAIATGGRAGDVYHVTTLDADKNGVVPGSLQYGINNAPLSGRTIVFDVGGTIYHEGVSANDRLRYGKAKITVAGQTAPSPGITIAGTGTKWTGDNIILRNISIRPNVNSNGTTHDAFDFQLKNSIVDHVSTSWFTDEGISQTDSGHTLTVQFALINEGLNYDGHSYGSIISTEVNGAENSFNHNLYAHNNSRMPRLGSEMAVTATGAVTDFTNNVIYNWPSRAGYSGTDQPSSTNFLGNYYIRGNNNGSTVFKGGDSATYPTVTKIFHNGNLYDGNKNGTADGTPVTDSQFTDRRLIVSQAFDIAGTGAVDSAPLALERVLDYGGANWNNRNPIEERIVQSVRNGTGNVINSTNGGAQAAEWATVLSQQPSGGVAPGERNANWDVDGDGMPSQWELEHGLDPNVANNNADFDNDGYTDLEEYINDIAAWPAPAPILFDGVNSRYAEIQNWRVNGQTVNIAGKGNTVTSSNWQPSRFDTAVINHGTVTVDAVGQHAGNVVLGMNPGDNVTVDITAGWLKVEDALHGLSDGITVIGDDPAATATLNLSGGELRTKSLLKGSGGSFNFTGGTLAAEEVGFDLVNNGGTISPGESPGTTHVMGDLTINSGSLLIELGGANTGEFDQLLIDGAANLGGTLNVSLLDGFQPSVGQFFQFATATGGIFYEFDSVELPTLSNGNALRLVYGETLVGLEVVTSLSGDFDGDGDIDGNDFLMWQRDSGVGDLADWQANYGAPLTANSFPVPEPVTALLCCGLGLILFARNRKN